MIKENKIQRNRRYYIHRVLKSKGLDVITRRRTINVPYDINIDQYPKLKELQDLNYSIQTTIK